MITPRKKRTFLAILEPIEPLGAPPAPSRHFREARIRAAANRLAWRIRRRTDRLLQRLDLPRLVGFIQRVQDGQ